MRYNVAHDLYYIAYAGRLSILKIGKSSKEEGGFLAKVNILKGIKRNDRKRTVPTASGRRTNGRKPSAKQKACTNEKQAFSGERVGKRKEQDILYPALQWTIKDSNLGPTGYEPGALTN